MHNKESHVAGQITTIARYIISAFFFLMFISSLSELFHLGRATIGTYIIGIVSTLIFAWFSYFFLPPNALFLKKVFLSHVNPKITKTKSQISLVQTQLQELNLKKDELDEKIDLDKQEHLNWTDKFRNLQVKYNGLESKYNSLNNNLHDDQKQVKFGGKLMTVSEALENRKLIFREFNDIKVQKKQITSFYNGKLFQDYLTYRVSIELNKIDGMRGLDFEEYVTNLLIKIGFKKAHVTSASGDNGIDVLAKNGLTYYGIQCKLYSNPVGNQAVQQAYAGGSYYKTDKNIVITNNYFTPSAKQAADTMDVDLWNRDKLAELIRDTFKIFNNSIE
ncbi:restriction endonuclease [Lentilactobacillus hilgardii]|uniref:restriction endonuclease n=1 Tax=Lentilactobacillus hilgardii TaxID=1588 RepID=UPI0021A6720F|nr:restriction endonuclease [Lentilactobacillus hilgardii]MCT3395383.1 hypothetical protein [Lentilactobacillus hilgardii]